MGTDPKTLARLLAQTAALRAAGKIGRGKKNPLTSVSRYNSTRSSGAVITPFVSCRYRGEDLRGAERERIGLSHFKTWAPCSHPDKPLGEFVCPCKGCGPNCSGYSPGEDTDVPEPSPLPPKPVKALSWAYGVTTVPERRDELLPFTLLQLKKAGFDAPRLFVDGSDDTTSWEREFALPVTARYPRVKAYGSWVLALIELYAREPLADRYAIFQDDFVTCRNLRQYLDACPYPDRGYLNLLTFMGNEELAPGYPTAPKTGWYKANQFGRGAVGLVFDRAAVKTLLSHPDAAAHTWGRFEDTKRGVKAIDGGVVTALKKAGFAEYVHHPSLVQHIGEVSVIGNRPHPLSKNFAGEETDALSFLKTSPERLFRV